MSVYVRPIGGIPGSRHFQGIRNLPVQGMSRDGECLSAMEIPCGNPAGVPTWVLYRPFMMVCDIMKGREICVFMQAFWLVFILCK